MSQTTLYILIAVILSALFSGLEIAFVSSSKLRLEMNKNNRNILHRLVRFFQRHDNEFIAAMLTGYILTLVTYGVLITRVIEPELLPLLGGHHLPLVLIEIVIAAFIVLVTGEFLPKTLFRIHPDATLRWLSLPAFVCYLILYPLFKLIISLSRGLLRLFGIRISSEEMQRAFTKAGFDYFIQSGLHEENMELNTEVQIFQNALDFSNVRIKDCLVPRTEIEAVDYTISLNDLKQRFIESGYSKLIVYKENIDNVVGYIHSSEMFRHPDQWEHYIQKAPIVPETMSAQKLMKIFMQQKKSLAVVVDEFGGTTGIVSMEDLVEEIFGEIEDEHDTTTYIAKKTGENEYILSARMEIERVNEMFDLHLPESEEYITIGGLILHHYQSFPKLHETVSIGQFQFKIITVTATKIELVKLKVTE